jgi:hypothetical protein
VEHMFERVRIYLSPVRETNDAHPRYRIKMSHLLGLFGATLDGCLTVGALDAGEAGPDALAVVEPDASRLPAIRARATEGLSALERVLARARGAYDAPLAR